jgi:hypothetical protein
MKEILTTDKLFSAAKDFCDIERSVNFPELIGIDNGKTIGTLVEHRLKNFLIERYDIPIGNSASGIDLPSEDINTDIKVTKYSQPQSSCPYKSSRQKIFGLGYNLLVLVYDKKDTSDSCFLNFLNCTFIEASRTADYTATKRISEMLKDGANKEDIIGYFYDRNIPDAELTHSQLADEVIEKGVLQGYLTISNALQWRLQYGRAIALENSVPGVQNYDIT